MSQPPNRLTRGDLVRSWLTWLFFSHATYNYERLQGLGFAHAMVPIIRKLYHTPQEISAALKRHLVFFNTEAQVGALVPGVITALEEERANGGDISDEAINGVKSGLMGPLSGLGDSITQGLITPILLALGISLASEGSLAGPLLYFLLASGAIISLSYLMWSQGYSLGKAAVEKLLAGGALRQLTEAASVMGMMVVGALAAQQVSLSLAANVVVGQKTVHLQSEVLDTVMKGALPLLLTVSVWWLLSRRRSPLAIIGLLFVLGIDGVLLGWLGWTPTTVTWQSVAALILTAALWWLLLTPGGKKRTIGTALVLLSNYVLLLWWGRVDLSAIAGTLVFLWWLWRGHPAAADAAW